MSYLRSNSVFLHGNLGVPSVGQKIGTSIAGKIVSMIPLPYGINYILGGLISLFGGLFGGPPIKVPYFSLIYVIPPGQLPTVTGILLGGLYEVGPARRSLPAGAWGLAIKGGGIKGNAIEAQVHSMMPKLLTFHNKIMAPFRTALAALTLEKQAKILGAYIVDPKHPLDCFIAKGTKPANKNQIVAPHTWDTPGECLLHIIGGHDTGPADLNQALIKGYGWAIDMLNNIFQQVTGKIVISTAQKNPLLGVQPKPVVRKAA